MDLENIRICGFFLLGILGTAYYAVFLIHLNKEIIQNMQKGT